MTCSKCGRAVAPGEPWCEVCRGPAEFSSRDRERMELDVRAHVLWGDPVEEIRVAWLKKGAPAEQVRKALEDSVRERHRHFRMRGFQDLLIAAGCFLGSGLAYWMQHAVQEGQIALPRKLTAYIMIASIVLPLAGLWFGFRGVRRVMSGGAAEKAASDLSEFE